MNLPRICRLGGVLAPLLVAAVGHLSAQCSGSAACTITISLPVTDRVMRLNQTPATATALGTPVKADFDSGYNKVAGPTFQAWANHSFAVSVIATTPTFTYVQSGVHPNPNKPASDLTWAAATSGGCAVLPNSAYISNAGSAGTLISSAIGAPGLGGTAPIKQICYRTLWPNASLFPAGTYTLIMNFTISAP